jgi:hypothetical protein
LNQTKVYVEIWGYSRDRNELEINYKKKRKRKEKVYEKLNLNLLSVEDSLFNKSFNDIYIEFSKLIQLFDKTFVPKELNLDYLLYGSKHSIKDLLDELNEIVKLNDGFFPSTVFLRKNGLEGLISRIQKFGGVEIFKKIMGLESRQYEHKWTLELLKEEIKKINGLTYLPPPSELEKIGRLDVQGGIQKNGGWKNVSILLDIPLKSDFLKTQPIEYQGKWSKTIIFEEVQEIIQNLKRFPNENDLKSLNKGGLHVGIKRFFGGLKTLKKEMGYSVKESVHVKEGEQFGKLKVLKLTNQNSVFRVLTICSCGMEYETRLDNFRDRYRRLKENLTCGKCKTNTI